MKRIIQSDIEAIVQDYPPEIQSRFQEFQTMVLELANRTEDINKLEESLKWGEPAFKSNIGSPFRFGWSTKRPDQFGIYFICTTTLVETFRQLYPDFFTFDGNRGLIFSPGKEFPKEPLIHCLELALRYKKVKDLPLLGA